MKIEEYVLVDHNGNYLQLEQVSNNDIDVSCTTDVTYATRWDTLDSIKDSAKEMVDGSEYWKYHYFYCTKPQKIVKVLKLIHMEDELDLDLF